MGEKFGGYTLLGRIGVGGMAEVFLARRTGVAGFEKDIVIKRIRPHLGQQQAFVNMFLDEAKLAAQLTHPNIVQIHDLGQIKNSYFIAMEYVAGRDLSAIIPRCRKLGIPFPIEYACKIGSSVCEALHYAHTKTDDYGNPLNIVHRDVSPENIRVGFTGVVKILDFGIAKAATQLHETKAGQIKGKLSYMSPEQVMGKNLDQRSDIFSLGAVLYETVTGLKLFTGDNDLAIMTNVVEGNFYPPSYFRDDVPREVEAIIMKALAKDRRKRYSSTADMQFDLDSFLAGHEFTPSNTHLANFVKQLFRDDIEAEQEARARTPRPVADEREQRANKSGAGQEVEADDHDVIELHDEATNPESQSHLGQSTDVAGDDIDIPIDVTQVATATVTPKPNGQHNLVVPLPREELHALEQLAARRQASPPELAREILADFLKYHR